MGEEVERLRADHVCALDFLVATKAFLDAWIPGLMDVHAMTSISNTSFFRAKKRKKEKALQRMMLHQLTASILVYGPECRSLYVYLPDRETWSGFSSAESFTFSCFSGSRMAFGPVRGSANTRLLVNFGTGRPNAVNTNSSVIFTE